MALSAIDYLQKLPEVSRAYATAGYVTSTWQRHRRHATPHRLPGRLTVTLTSHPPRYPTLALTLKSLLAQSILPDRLCLWIAEADLASLPRSVVELQTSGLAIQPCENLRSYTKIIPALASGGDDLLVTADDEVYYPRHWLRGLVEARRGDNKEALCTRGHRIRVDARGVPVPYAQWETDVEAGEASRLIFPTGVGGVLWEPGMFHADVTRAEIFQILCPTADDIWLYWMAAMTGTRFRKVGPRMRVITWPRTQRFALYAVNRTKNDKQIENLIARYGFPGGATL